MTNKEMVNFQKLDFLGFFICFNYKLCQYMRARIERDWPDLARSHISKSPR